MAITQALNQAPNEALIEVNRVCKSFPRPNGKGEHLVLKDISLTVRSGEIVALLGRSGSGKSTLLRAMAGLLIPSKGQVLNNGKPLLGPNPDVAFIFQSFALLPWLTVLENTELGLEAKAVDRAVRKAKAIEVLDLVGLDGFESAYPKELSGGMKQRVGFARAFVMKPKVLFMDEPFSALDVLTKENLRGEIDDLWNAGQFPSASIVIVTHDIEEAVFLADRIVVLGANPGHIRGEVAIDLPRSHDRGSPQFKAIVDRIYTVMTNPDVDVTQAANVVQISTQTAERSPFSQSLPQVRAGAISGLLELLVEQSEDPVDIYQLADRLHLTVDDLLPLLHAADLLKFAEVTQGDVSLTDLGRDFATTTILRSKDLFRQQVLNYVPMVTGIEQILHEKRNGSMRADFFLDLLDEYFPHAEIEQQFSTAVDWGRYAELFEYDAREERFYLPKPVN
jgi:NitT/TauT family transport system ATP-binding protein